MPLFDQGSIEEKSGAKVKMCPLVAELKFKMLNKQQAQHFQFQLCYHAGGTFTFPINGPKKKKDMSCINKCH